MEDLRQSIEKAFNLKIIGEQRYPWGESYWLQLDPKDDKKQRSVSIVTIYPAEMQHMHTHPGYEEIIFGLEGESTHWSNDRQINLGKGQLGYIPSGGQHKMLNNSQSEARFLSIVYPIIPTILDKKPHIEEVNLADIIKTVNLDAIAEKFASSVHLAVTLVDKSGNLLTEPKNLPQFCLLCRKEQSGDCIICSSGKGYEGKDLREFRCKFGLSAIHSPIIINERLLGYLGCGYGRVFMPTPEDELFVAKSFSKNEALAKTVYINLDILNRNHLKSVAETLSLVSVSLVQLIIDAARDKQVSNYKLSLSQEENRKTELENSLNEVKLKFLESQVNPHFLFNTLNTIAQTAVMEGATTSASLSYALSNLLRCSLGKTDSLITIQDEIKYIKDYLTIQKTRFPNRFDIDIEIPEDILLVKIPFLSIMTMVENSIIHGFSNIRRKGSLKVKGYSVDEMAVIEVSDNGSGVPADVLEKVKENEFSSFSGKSIGLKNLYKRMEYYFGDRFKFDIESYPDKGTIVTIRLPK